jgi:enamine deaminase RidA (YjgF/YER057c/UK114 family)
MSYEKKLADKGYTIPPKGPRGLIDAVSIDGTTLDASGQVPFDGPKLLGVGKVPSQVSVADATKYAELCAVNILRAVHQELGSLDRIERVLRVTGYVNADTDFTDCHLVIHGATNLFLDIFGEAGRHARTALSMAQLPLGVSVEVEAIFKLRA